MKAIKLIFSIFTILLLTFIQAFPSASVKLPFFFGSNMVVQREKPIKIWGTYLPKKEFKIEFAGKQQKVTADKTGNWNVVFPSMEAGGPYEMKFKADSCFAFTNILVGDVWFCSGQSNMEWKLLGAYNSGYELRNSQYPEIRNFTVPKNLSSVPLSNTLPSVWEICTPRNAAFFSAIAYFFAKNIHLNEHIPIGIINDSWGGTVIESWTGMESLASHPDFKEKVSQLKLSVGTDGSFESKLKKTNEETEKWQKLLESKDQGLIEKWYSSEYIPKNWDSLIAPGYIEDYGLKNFDGIVWLRKDFIIPSQMLNKDLLVNLEILNNYDKTYLNGVEIGSTTWTQGRRIYFVPSKLIKEGVNSLVIRLENGSIDGGFLSKNPFDLRIQELIESNAPLIIPLSGKWVYKSTLRITDYPIRPKALADQSTPSSIYNAMVAPFTDFAIKGFLWYQGESNSWRAYQYRTLFPLMITDWRKQFRQGDLPFLYVQLAGFLSLTESPVESYLAELREAQTMALSLPKTGMAVTIDIGNPYDVHPTNKQEVGRRLALEAEKIAYNKTGILTSPLYQGMKIEGNKIRLFFNNAESGLSAKKGDLKGFSIAGGDKHFVWAKADIHENEIVVWSNEIKNPVAVRYAWTGSPVESNGANLYNNEGLPSSPFRTDNWDGITINNK